MSVHTADPLPDATVPLAECPYRGLQPYREQDAEYYFGRDRERDLVIANVMATRLTVLYGPSGVGKSSLLRAGVVRTLTAMPESSFGHLAIGHTVVAYQARWREDPLGALGDALRAAVPAELADDYRPEPLSLELVAEVSRRLDAHVFLILDQFEEESLYCSAEATRALAVELGRVVDAAGVRASVLIGIREDSLAKLDELEAHLPGLFDNTLRLDHLNAAAARAAIEQPLVRYNADRAPADHVTIEPALVDELLVQLRTGRLSVTDAAGRLDTGAVTIETPYLQLVMTRLWGEERAEGSSMLRLSTLRRLGDSEHIVRTHLDNVMAQLTHEQQEVAAGIFRFLVTPSGMKIAHTAKDLAEYASLADGTALGPVLEELSSGRERILRPVEPPVDRPGVPRYEIFHDVLAPAILDWRQRFVAEQARVESERRLVEEREEADRQHDLTRRQLRRSRLFSGALVLLLVAALVAGVMAKLNGDRARARELLSQSEEKLKSDPAESLARAVEAQSRASSPDTERAVRSALEADRERLRITAPSGYRNVVAFSPDGSAFVAAGSSPTAVLHDVATGRLVREFPLASGAKALWAGFSNDGAMLALTTDEGQTTVHDLDSGTVLLTIEHPAYQSTVPRWVTKDGEPMLVASGKGDSVDVWQPRTGERVDTFGDADVTDYDSTVETSRDGTKVLTCQQYSTEEYDWVSTLRVWDVTTGRLLAESNGLSGDGPSLTIRLEDGSTITPSGEVLSPTFLGADDSTIAFWIKYSDGLWRPAFWNWGTDTLVATDVVSREPSMVTASTDGAKVAVIVDEYATVFSADDVAGASKVSAAEWLHEQPDLLTAVRFSPDGEMIATAGVAGKALVWRLGGPAFPPVQRLHGHRGEIADVRFSPTQPELLLTSGYDGTVRLWELSSQTVSASSYRRMVGADVSDDGRQIISVSDQGQLWAVDAGTGDLIDEDWIIGDADNWRADFDTVEWIPGNQQRVAVASNRGDWAPWIWNLASDEVPDTLKDWADQPVHALSVRPDGARIAMGDDYNNVVVWDVASGKIEPPLTAGDDSFAIMDVEFIPSSSLLAAASVDGTVRIWDVARPDEPPRELGAVGAAPVVVLRASQDGVWLAVTSVDRAVRLYDLSSSESEPASMFQGPAAGLGDLAFAADGTLLFGAAGDGAVYVWERASGHLRTVLPRHGAGVNSVRILPDGRLVTASDDGTTIVSPCSTCGDFAAVLEAARTRIAARAGGTTAPLDSSADAADARSANQATARINPAADLAGSSWSPRTSTG